MIATASRTESTVRLLPTAANTQPPARGTAADSKALRWRLHLVSWFLSMGTFACAPAPTKVCQSAASLVIVDSPVPSESCGDTAELVPIPGDGFCEDTSRLALDDLPVRTLDAIRRTVDPTPDFPAIAAPCDDHGRCFEYVVCGVIDYESLFDPWPVGATPFGAEKVVMTRGDRNRLLVADVSGEVESIEFEGFSSVGIIGVAGSEVWVAVARSDAYYVGAWEVDGGGEVILEPFPGDFRTLWGFVGADGEYFWTVEDPGSLQPRICGLRPDGTLRTVAVLDDDIFYNHLWRRRWLPRQVGSWVYIDAERKICVDEVDDGFAVREEVIFPIGEAPYSGLEPPEYPIYHVTDGKYVYFTSDLERCEGYDECDNPPPFRDGIWRAPVTGGEAEPLFPDLPDVADSALSLHGGWLYWALEEDQSVYRTHTETLETHICYPQALHAEGWARWPRSRT